MSGDKEALIGKHNYFITGSYFYDDRGAKMSAIFKDIVEAVGYTPLVKINKLGTSKATILGKLESANPCGSVKDRIAKSMIAAGEKAGMIKPNTVIIEPTSGNTGIGLACVCACRGYKLILAMPESMSIERRKVLKQFGAELVLTPAEKGMSGAVEKAEELVAQYPDSFMPQQFINPANVKAHRETTAIEIWNDTDGDVDIFVAGIGTGGTITGCGLALKEKNRDIKVVGVEPEDSAVLSGGQPGPHKIQGIGAGFVPDILDKSVIDEIMQVSNNDAIETARQLASREGILVGISAGAALWAAVRISERPESEGKTIVTVLCDTGERYISTELFD